MAITQEGHMMTLSLSELYLSRYRCEFLQARL
jgi:hypothetical protein